MEKDAWSVVKQRRRAIHEYRFPSPLSPPFKHCVEAFARWCSFVLGVYCPSFVVLTFYYAFSSLFLSGGVSFLCAQLLEKIWDYCNMIRIYTKPKGQIPDYNEPVILHDTNPSLEQFCNRIHKVSSGDRSGSALSSVLLSFIAKLISHLSRHNTLHVSCDACPPTL